MTSRARNHAWYVLGLLTAINFVNYVDRLVIVSMYGEFRTRFHMTDTQLGLLTTGFFVVHALTTLPFGWAADRFDRRKIIAIGVITWSLATLASGWAVGFLSLLMLRAAIGIGEAAYLPVANSILCEVFPADQKARTIGIFNGGMFAGACVGVIAGGYLGFPTAFWVVAIPGLVMGIMALRLNITPVRSGTLHTTRATPLQMLKDGWTALDVPTVRLLVVVGVLVSFTAGGYIAWFVDFVVTLKKIPRGQATVIFGLITIVGGGCGVIVGGIVADRLKRRYRSGRVLAVGLGMVLAAPFAVGSILLPAGPAFYVCSSLVMFFIPWYNGPIAAVIDDVVDDHRATTAQASSSLVLHLVGTGPAAAVIGVLSSSWGLERALLLPTVTIFLAGLVCIPAARTVARDMDAREARAVAAAAIAARTALARVV